MSRQKTIVDMEEVEEIISLKLRELGGIKSKLSYNSVWLYNKGLVERKYKRSNGKLFNLYGYTFWASSYNGEEYLGKQIIDKMKGSDSIILAGESFSVETQDILCLVDKYFKNPQELAKRLIKIFEKDRKKVESLKVHNERLSNEVVKLRKSVELLEHGFATMFYNSKNSDNSLLDVMSLKKSGDGIVLDELKNIFNQDESKIGKILNGQASEMNNPSSTNVVRLQRRKRLEDEGL